MERADRLERRDWVRRRTVLVHRVAVEFTRVSACATLLRDENESFWMFSNMVLSRKDDVSSASVTTSDGKEDGTVENTLEPQKEKRCMPSVHSEMVLRRFSDENVSLTVGVNEHKLLVSNSKEKTGRKELYRITLLQDLMRFCKRWSSWI